MQRFTFLRALRALRALRPLRLISRMPGLKMVVGTLCISVPPVSQYLAVAAIFLVIFAIAAVQIFGGRFGYCLDPLYADLPYGSRVVPGVDANGTTDFAECMALESYNLSRHNSAGAALTTLPADEYAQFYAWPRWVQPSLGTLDNVPLAMLLLFEIAASEGWPDVLFYAMDTHGGLRHAAEPRTPTSGISAGRAASLHLSTASGSLPPVALLCPRTSSASPLMPSGAFRCLRMPSDAFRCRTMPYDSVRFVRFLLAGTWSPPS